MRSRLLLIAFLFALSGGMTSSQTTDIRLMTEVDYKSFLLAVEAKLPEWRAAFKAIDPAKTNLSYAVGEKVVRYRDIGLMQIESAANYTKQESLKHSVASELWLQASLQGIYDSMQAMVVYDPSLELSVEKYAPEIGGLVGKIAKDSYARVELLEKGTCP
jgi:hypothetical protein